MWCKTSGILSGPDCSCVQMPGLSKKLPLKVFFLPKNLARKFPGKKNPGRSEKNPEKQPPSPHFIDGAQEPPPVFCTTDRTGHARTEM
jgi:hypothetical protein